MLRYTSRSLCFNFQYWEREREREGGGRWRGREGNKGMEFNGVNRVQKQMVKFRGKIINYSEIIMYQIRTIPRTKVYGNMLIVN